MFSLRPEVLPEISDRVEIPTYDRSRLRRSIVHIGVGGFHRSHLGSYVDDLCRAATGSGRSSAAECCRAMPPWRRRLAASNACTASSCAARSDAVRIVGKHRRLHPRSPPAPPDWWSRFPDPDTQMVSLTVTEGGYPIEEGNRRYDPESPMAGKGSPSASWSPAWHSDGHDAGPLSVVSCDNIVSNGEAARTATLGEAKSIDPALAAWVERRSPSPTAWSTGSLRPRPTPTVNGC